MKPLLYVFATLLLFSSCNSRSDTSSTDLPNDLKIAYNVLLNEEEDDYEIFVMNLDGSEKTNICNSKGVDWVYYAYDDKLYFLSDRDTCYRCYFLYEMDANGDNVRKITNFRLRDSWLGSRKNGEEFIVNPHKSVDSVFYIINKNGEILSKLATGLPYASDPYFSPDGTQVVFRGAKAKFKKDSGYLDELYIINDDGSDLHQLTSYPTSDTTAKWHNYHAGPPRWNTSTNLITYNSTQRNKNRLFSIKPDGSDNQQITADSVYAAWHDVAGNWIVHDGKVPFNDQRDNYDIYLSNGATTHRLTTDSLYQQAPVFVRFLK